MTHLLHAALAVLAVTVLIIGIALTTHPEPDPEPQWHPIPGAPWHSHDDETVTLNP